MKTNKDYKYAYRLATREVHRPAERPKKKLLTGTATATTRQPHGQTEANRRTDLRLSPEMIH